MDRFSEMVVFLSVARQQSFSAASRSLWMSPSAVSKIIGRLEMRLGVKLFNRTSKVTLLTAEGETFYKAAQRAITSMEEAEASVMNFSDSASGLLRIRSISFFAVHKIAPLLPEFLERYPHLRLDFLIGGWPDFSGAHIDVTFQISPLPDTSLTARKMQDLRWIICAAPSYVESYGRPRTRGDLVAHRCLNFRSVDAWRVWAEDDPDGELAKALASPTVSANNGAMLLNMVLAGVGVARLPDFQVAKHIAQGSLIQLFEPGPSDHSAVYALFEGRDNVSPRIRCFLDFLREKLRDSPADEPPRAVGMMPRAARLG